MGDISASLILSLIILHYHSMITEIKALNMLKVNTKRSTVRLKAGLPNIKGPRQEVQS
ncbi:hypothetical protein ACVWYN_001503 [Pedobacter sp. UYP24]